MSLSYEGVMKMGKTITEKILARASGRKEVSPGDLIWTKIDVLFTHETVGPRVFNKDFEELGGKICDTEKFVVFIDHYNLPSSIQQAEIVKYTVDWSRKHGVKYLYKFCGPEHQILVEEGFVLPGTLILGTDSHTTTAGALGAFATGIGSTECAIAITTGMMWLQVPESIKLNWEGHLPRGAMAKDMILYMIGKLGHDGATYKACEFTGSTIDELSIDGRLVLTNMSVEMGAKNGIINPDDKTLGFVKSVTDAPFTPIRSDPDAEYEKEHYFDADDLEPLVACPDNVDNVKAVADVEGTTIDSALIGTCTGGRLEDMKAAASILRGRRIHEKVTLLIVPASWKVYRAMLTQGLVEMLLDAGCILTQPTCGPCAGHLGGLLASGDIRLSAQNRNFKGRSGSQDAKIYLASPLTCAASAIKGEITDPRRFL